MLSTIPSSKPFPFTFTEQTTIHIPGALHQLATTALIIQVHGLEPESPLLGPDVMEIDPTTYDVTLRFCDHEEIVDPLASQADDGWIQRWYKGVRHGRLMQWLWPLKYTSRRIPAHPHSGTVFLFPGATV